MSKIIHMHNGEISDKLLYNIACTKKCQAVLELKIVWVTHVYSCNFNYSGAYTKTPVIIF